MYSRVARSPRLFAVSQRLAALGTRLVSPFSDYVPLPAFTGWGYSKDLPRFAGRPFRARFQPEEANSNSVILSPSPGDASQSTSLRVNSAKDLENEKEDSSVAALPQNDVRIAQFIEELTRVNGNVIRTDKADLTSKVIDFLKSREIEQIHLEPGALDESALQEAGIAVSHEPDAGLRLGVTKALCGLADTGSILVADGEGQPLQASLLPRIHLAVLRTADILPSLANAMSLPAVRHSKSAVVITGPSRTADIEMSLTLGMHGPGELNVFLVHGTASTLVHSTASTLVDD